MISEKAKEIKYASSTIHVLDEQTSNRIAAGEVIERPASVVKELVENSLDARASTIIIEITSDSKYITGIKVTDNGTGMNREDAVLCFKKHATSKIRSIDDLTHLKTMGFRGEALASIASVAIVEMVTKPNEKNVLSGTKIAISGGEILAIEDAASPGGTSVSVRDLFYNTPARKKFLKKKHTELAHIIGTVHRQALGHVNVSFLLVHNGSEIFRTAGTPDIKSIMAGIFGQDVYRKLIPFDAGSGYANVSGFISTPDLNRSDRYDIHIYINSRPVFSNALSGAVKEGYGTLLAKDRYPIAFLNIVIDPSLVDVNVHPTKSQVRLSHEKELSGLIKESVENVLREHDLIFEGKAPATSQVPLPSTEFPVYTNYRMRDTAGPGSDIIRETGDLIQTERRLRQVKQAALPSDKKDKNRLPEMEIIGQVGLTYIAARTGSGDLILIDQHAAHERILFEEIYRKSGDIKRQELLVPVNIDLNAREQSVLMECIPYLEEYGFRIEEFGKDTYSVVAVPVITGRIEDPETIHDIISDILNEGDIKKSTGIREKITKIMACRSALKAGEPCTHEQAEKLIDQLKMAEEPFTCPHGRPVIISFSKDKLDDMFRRK